MTRIRPRVNGLSAVAATRVNFALHFAIGAVRGNVAEALGAHSLTPSDETLRLQM